MNSAPRVWIRRPFHICVRRFHDRLHLSNALPPTMAVLFSVPIEVAVSTTSIACALLSAVWLGVLYRFRQTPIIKAHSYAFLSLSVFGSLLAVLSVLTWPLDSPSALCAVRPWAFTVPLYILLCPLLAKHYRIHRIFNTSTLTAQKWGVSDLHVSLLFSALLVPQLVINIAWAVRAPLTQEAITLASGSVIHDCHASTESSVFAWLSVAYLGCLLLAAVYLTLRLRHLADEFNQSKDILSCALLIVGAAAVIIALQVTSETDYDYRYAIRSFGLIGILVAWQVVIMLPKLLAIRRERRGGAAEFQGLGGGKQIARLPLSPHTMKQIASYHSAPGNPVLASRKQALEAKAGKDTVTVKVDTVTAASGPVIHGKGKSNYPALSTLMTFMAPTEEKENPSSPTPAASRPSEVELVIDPASPPADVNSLNRVSVSANNPSPGGQAEGPSASSAPGKGNAGAGRGHLRSKSHAPVSAREKTVAGREDKLPSMKATKAQLLANSVTEQSLGAGGSGTVNGKQSLRMQPGRGKGADYSAMAFKPNLEDHLSPLYTPAAITVEQVPIFMQDA